MTTISAVIPHFYVERVANLSRIADALYGGTHPPLEVLVWNNTAQTLPAVKGVSVLQSHMNLGAKARFLAALAARGDLVFFQDNDVSVQHRTLERLAYWHEALGGVVTIDGRMQNGGRYSSWPKIYGHGIRKPTSVDLSLGRGELVERRMLPRVLSAFPFEESTVMDDLWFSRCVRMAGVPIHVVPVEMGVSSLAELSMGGVGLCKEPTFATDRDRAVAEMGRGAWEALKAEAERC